MTKSKAPTLRQFQQRFRTEDSCLDHLFQVRYGEDFHCPKCGRPAKYSRVKSRRSYQCQWCANQLYPTAGTPFDRTRTSLRDWFYVMFQFCMSRNGVAAKRVERDLGVTYKTAWRMCHEIRKYMAALDSDDPLGGPGTIVEVDETSIGGNTFTSGEESPEVPRVRIPLEHAALPASDARPDDVVFHPLTYGNCSPAMRWVSFSPYGL